MLKTSSIDKTVKKLNLNNEYNKNRNIIVKTLSAYKKNIIEDGIKTERLKCDLLTELYKIRQNFYSILKLIDKIKLYFFIYEVNKKISDVDFEKITSYLAYFIGRFNKKEI